MSCWRTYSCEALKNVDKELAKKALEKMGVQVDETVKFIDAPYAVSEVKSGNVDAGFIKNGNAVPVGVIWKNADGLMEIVGDFWRTGIDEEEFMNTVAGNVMKATLENQLELMGYTIDEATLEETETEFVGECYQFVG